MLLNDDGKKGREGKTGAEKTDSFLKIAYEFASGALFCVSARHYLNLGESYCSFNPTRGGETPPRWLEKSSLTQQPSFLPCVGGVTLVITTEHHQPYQNNLVSDDCISYSLPINPPTHTHISLAHSLHPPPPSIAVHGRLLCTIKETLRSVRDPK